MSPRSPFAAAMLVAGCLPLAVFLLSAQALVPSAPRNFTGSASGATITLSWDAPLSGQPIFYYVLDIGHESDTYDASVPVGQLTRVSADVGEGVYYFRIRAVNADGPGAPSPEVAVTVGAAGVLPGAPQNLLAGMIPNVLTLTWDAPSEGLPLTGYVLYAGTFPGTSNLLRLPIGSTTPTLSLPIGGVTAGTYFLRVAAVNAVGEGPVNNEVSVTVTSGGAPGAPGHLTATIANGRLILNWEPPAVGEPISYYNVYVSDVPGMPQWANWSVVGAASFSIPFGGAPPGTYYFVVTAVNEFGEGPGSNEVTLTFGQTPPPSPPVNPVASLSGAVITISWQPPTTGGPILDYVVHISNIAGGDTFRRATGGATTWTTPWTGAAPGTYYFYITAVNAYGVSQPSANVSITVGQGEPPFPPLSLFVDVDSSTLTAWWYAPNYGSIPLTGYVLYVGTSPGASNVLRQPLGLDTLFSLPIAGATPGIYYFRVTAVNMFGESVPSNEVTVVIGNYCAVPAAPRLSGSVSGDTVSLTWTTPTGGPVGGYTVFVADGPGQPFTPVGTVGPENAISGPASPGTYLVRVAANAACGQGPPSNTVTLTVP
jgi:predicted phage tail protein